MFESTLGEGDRVSLRETTLEEETGGVWGRQTLEARGRGPLQGRDGYFSQGANFLHTWLNFLQLIFAYFCIFLLSFCIFAKI